MRGNHLSYNREIKFIGEKPWLEKRVVRAKLVQGDIGGDSRRAFPEENRGAQEKKEARTKKRVVYMTLKNTKRRPPLGKKISGASLTMKERG